MTNPYGQQQPPYGQPQSGGFPQQPQPGYGPPSGGMPAYGQPAPYGQPPTGGFGAPGYGMPGGGDINAIKDYKGWAIGCIFLMWILAIFAIMKSNEVQTYKMQGNYAMAEQASNTTRTLCLIATIIGALGWIFAIIMIIISIAAAASIPTYCTSYSC
ncbi:CD225/dispanin family protein [Amycolatopsis sp. NBC_01488]|uniref:CD225/dispanin family protein n=1 Tax=Amycolatopsis sp. NBC_01488 TaxID=2903563 RepID=UPI002E2D187F|nr:CD225/dispanin family protein [Amycolatopsis sp. NBC_01488]